MLNFTTNILDPSYSLSLLSSTNALLVLETMDSTKGSLYCQKPYTVQIIQLVEGSPPPRNISSARYCSSEDRSSSYCSSSSYSSSECSRESEACSSTSEEEEEPESVCSSYCSSDEELATGSEASSLALTSYDSFQVKRILAWRDDFYAQLGVISSENSSTTLKRKHDVDADSDVASQHSKRSRSSVSKSPTPIRAGNTKMAHCPACDATFHDEHQLRLHGQEAQATLACNAAVSYAFEYSN